MKTNKQCKRAHSGSRTGTFSPVDNALWVTVLYRRLQVKSLKKNLPAVTASLSLSLLSPLTWVWIMSSKMLALSSSPLAMRRMVYTAPGLRPSIMWKLCEVFTASEILQLPSPWSAQTAGMEQFTASKWGKRSTRNLYISSTNQRQI